MPVGERRCDLQAELYHHGAGGIRIERLRPECRNMKVRVRVRVRVMVRVRVRVRVRIRIQKPHPSRWP